MRVPRMRLALPFAFCFMSLICNAVVLWSQSTTTTVTISNTVETSGIDRPGTRPVVECRLWFSQQLLKSLNYAIGRLYAGTVLWSDDL